MTSITLSFMGCRDQDQLSTLTSLGPVPAPPQLARGSVNVNFCTDAIENVTTLTKVLLIYDQSGSNYRNINSSSPGNLESSLATDPDGAFRYGDVSTRNTVLNYIDALSSPVPSGSSGRIAFSKINFSSPERINLYPSPSASVVFDSNPSDFKARLQSERNCLIADPSGQSPPPCLSYELNSGWTDYVGALQKANQLISGDISLSEACSSGTSAAPCPFGSGVPTTSYYSILFVSDGSPVIESGRESDLAILGEVRKIANLGMGHSQSVSGISLSTIYYVKEGNPDPLAGPLLSSMARLGNGQFFNLRSNDSIYFVSVLPAPTQAKYQLAEAFVTNVNMTKWIDGRYYSDSDGDGLPDQIELTWGSNPTRVDSFSSGISDLTYYTYLAGTAPHPSPSFNACSAVLIRSGPLPQFRTSDPNGLNDCEKILLNDSNGIGNPDSNANLIPDWLEFTNGLPFQVGSSALSSSGGSVVDMIKRSIPIYATDPASFSGVTQTISPLPQPSGLAGDVSCYQLNTVGIPMLTPTDSIRVDIMMRSSLGDHPIRYKKAIKRFSTSSSNLTINGWNYEGVDPAWSSP